VADIVLTVPDAMLPQLMSAIRAAYADVTAGLADTDAIKAVGKFWLATTFAGFASQQARAAAQADVDTATTARDEAATAAWQQAWDAVQAIP
jgi:nicotinamide mononucleotide (NMN) deamidase PncC